MPPPRCSTLARTSSCFVACFSLLAAGCITAEDLPPLNGTPTDEVGPDGRPLDPNAKPWGAAAYAAGYPLAGAWLGTWATDANSLDKKFEAQIGSRLDWVDTFVDWYTPWADVAHTAQHLARRGIIPMITWEPHGFTTKEISAGTKSFHLRKGRETTVNDYVAEWATGACKIATDTNVPVFLRTMHEMNGGWYSWGVSYQGSDGRRPNTDASYREAWIKIHNAFSSRCGDKVKFVWAVNHYSVGDGVTVMGTYPGDAYVDLIGIDGYNWGSRAEWGWQGFETLFRATYCKILERVQSKPIVIPEVGSTESGGDKPAWIRDLFASMQRYGHLRGFVWLHDSKFEVEVAGEMDWPVDSSPASLFAFQQGVKGMHDARTPQGTYSGSSEEPC